MEMTSGEAAPLGAMFDQFWKSPPSREVTDKWFKGYTLAYKTAPQKRSQVIAAAERPKPGKSKAQPKRAVLQDRVGLMTADWKTYLRRLRVRAEFGAASIDGKNNSYLRTLSIVSPIVVSGLAHAQHEDVSRAMGKTDSCGWFGTVHLIQKEGARLYKDESLRARIDKSLAPIQAVAAEEDCIAAAREAFGQLRQIGGLGHCFITRMLAVAKPDRFYSVNGKSDDGLATLLGITKAQLATWAGYEHGLRLIYRTPWYRSARPTDRREQTAWEARVALIDAYAYAS